MIVCRTCGRANPDDADFCADCGRYLAWVGEYVAPEPEPEPEETVEEEAPAPARPGFFRRLGLRLRILKAPAPPDEPPSPAAVVPLVPSEAGQRDDEDLAVAAAADEDTEVPLDTVAVPMVAGDPDDEMAADLVGLVGSAQAMGAGTAGALALSAGDVVTSPGVTTSRPTPALRRPTEIDLARQARQRRRTAVVSLPTGPESPRPGDVFCPRCKQFNPPSRHFCRRCGAELDLVDIEEEPEYRRLNFWHRHVRRDVRVTNAGARPGKWGKASSGGGSANTRMRLMGRVGAVVIAGFVIFSYVGPYTSTLRSFFSGAYHSVVKKVDVTYTQQFAIGANASTSYPNHPAGLAVDDADNTYWQSLPSKKENGIGQWLTVLFPQAITLNRIGILAGAGPSEQTWLGEARPKTIQITVNRNGPRYVETLQDTIGFQHLDITALHVTSVMVRVLSVYPSATGHAVAITEIEFFQRT